MGEYLRRYWQPIGGASELDDNPIKADAAARRGPRALQGPGRALRPARPALPASPRRPLLRLRRGDRHPLQLSRLADGRERRAASSSPTTTRSIRTRAPRNAARTKAYPVQECAGLLLAYMGPQPAPELPVWEPFTWENGFREIVLSDVPCNWFQCQENSCDPVHFEWMHDNWALRLKGQTGPCAASTSSSSSRSSTTASSTSACARTQDESDPLVDRGPRRALAERLLSRQSLRMARAGRRREHAQRRVVLHARAEGPRAVRAGQGADLVEPDQGRQAAAGSRATSSTRTSSPGSGRAHRRPHQGEPRRERPRHRDDPQALLRRHRRDARAARSPRA